MQDSTWKLFAESGGAVLGVALSLYTVFSTIEGRLRKLREQHALIRQLREEVLYFVTLARHLAQRAEQVVALYNVRGGSYPDPAAEADTLPESAVEHGKWLVARTRHLGDYPMAMDVKELASMLSKRQIDRLLSLKQAQRTYLQVLITRSLDLDAFPRRPGVLVRFTGVARINSDDILLALEAFSQSLGEPGVRSKPAAN